MQPKKNRIYFHKPELLQQVGYQFHDSNSTTYHQSLYQSPFEEIPEKTPIRQQEETFESIDIINDNENHDWFSIVGGLNPQ